MSSYAYLKESMFGILTGAVLIAIPNNLILQDTKHFLKSPSCQQWQMTYMGMQIGLHLTLSRHTHLTHSFVVNTRTLSKNIYRNRGRYCALGTCIAVLRIIQPALEELQEGEFSHCWRSIPCLLYNYCGKVSPLPYNYPKLVYLSKRMFYQFDTICSLKKSVHSFLSLYYLQGAKTCIKGLKQPRIPVPPFSC